jgi:hypothetical protein
VSQSRFELDTFRIQVGSVISCHLAQCELLNIIYIPEVITVAVGSCLRCPLKRAANVSEVSPGFIAPCAAVSARLVDSISITLSPLQLHRWAFGLVSTA